MIKKLKTLNKIKSEALKTVEDVSGIDIYYKDMIDKYYISGNMYSKFDKKIEVHPFTPQDDDFDDRIWDWEDNEGWVYIEKWFDYSLFTDDDFMI